MKFIPPFIGSSPMVTSIPCLLGCGWMRMSRNLIGCEKIEMQPETVRKRMEYSCWCIPKSINTPTQCPRRVSDNADLTWMYTCWRDVKSRRRHHNWRKSRHHSRNRRKCHNEQTSRLKRHSSNRCRHIHHRRHKHWLCCLLQMHIFRRRTCWRDTCPHRKNCRRHRRSQRLRCRSRCTRTSLELKMPISYDDVTMVVVIQLPCNKHCFMHFTSTWTEETVLLSGIDTQCKDHLWSSHLGVNSYQGLINLPHACQRLKY